MSEIHSSGAPQLRVRVLTQGATPPSYQSAGAAGMDLSACLASPVVIQPGEISRIPTGLALAIPDGYEGQIRPRSGLASKSGVTLPNAPGTIDSDYRGEVIVPLINLGRSPFEVKHGMRIAQLVISAVARVVVVGTMELDATARGDRGFGSTGTH